MNAPPVDRHLSPAAAVRLLGTWHAGGPAYVALADALRQAVLAGSLAPHTRLPSERELAVALGVSRATTTAAYRRLRDLGFAVARTGSGTVAVLPRPATPSAREAGGDAPSIAPGAWPGDVVDLSQATSPAPPQLHDAFVRALDALPAYLARGGYEPYGVPALRAAIAERYCARGCPTTPEQILVTTGGQHAIALLAGTVVRSRDAVVVQDPTYVHAMEAMRAAGARLVGVPFAVEDGLDLDGFVSALRRVQPRLAYLVPDFHNPTGATLTAEQRAEVRAAADRFGVTVVGDETLTDLMLDGADGGPAGDGEAPPPFAGDGTSPHVLCVGSASKTFWGGLRIGWIRAHPDVVAQLARARGAVDIASPLLEQLAVVELLARCAAVLADRRVALREQRDVLVDGLRDALPWDVPRPTGGLSLWPSLGAPLAQAFAAAAAAEGVLVNAGPTFSAHGASADRVRLTFGRSVADLERALPRLVRAWSRLTT